MFQAQSRVISKYFDPKGPIDGIIASVRHFSLSQRASNIPGQPNLRVAPNSPVSHSRSSTSAPRKANNPTVNTNSKSGTSRRVSPQRVIDARSLAVPKGGSLPTNILRSPRFQKVRNGAQARGRRIRTPTTAAASKGRRKGNLKVQRKRTDVEEVDEGSQAEIEEVYARLSKTSESVASRYNPQSPDYSTLNETWPSLPTDVTSRTAGVVEKLSQLSDRFPNGYVPPHELGKRLFEGLSVRFFSEEERSLALTEAQKLAQQRADTLSQRKGNLMEPEDISFKQMSEEDKKILIETLVRGNYSNLETKLADKHHVLHDVLKNLGNNETYRTAGKNSQFIAKVESLLASGRPVAIGKA